jgi:membrane-associated phospholipid phosphatase
VCHHRRVAELAGKLHEAVEARAIAPEPAQRRRARIFQLYVLLASAGFVALAVAAHARPYFAVDLAITKFIQSYHGQVFDFVMRAVSWIGFTPQSYFVGGAFLLTLFVLGYRWETLAALFAAAVSAVGAVIKLIVVRPRPTADLVHVFRAIPDYGFPSGHVLTAVALGGFLGFLAYTLLKRSWQRTIVLACFAFGILLMGPSRIYMGQHWFSDTMGAYVLGSLWLLLSIKLYRRLKHGSHARAS